MKGKISIVTACILYSCQASAFFCPSNFNQINLGDTIQQVGTQCGKPASENSYKSEANVPQEWSYYVSIAQDMYTLGASQGTMKLTFAFVKSKVVNITSNGIGVGATGLCNNVNLQLGNTSKDVEKACGKAATITKTNLAGSEEPPTEVIEWKYNGPPPTTLVFENGILTERRQS